METCLAEAPLCHVGVGAVEVFGADEGADDNANASAEVCESREAVLPAVREEIVDGGGAKEEWNCYEMQEEYAVDAGLVRISVVERNAFSYSAIYRLMIVQTREKKRRRKGRVMVLSFRLFALILCPPTLSSP